MHEDNQVPEMTGSILSGSRRSIVIMDPKGRIGIYSVKFISIPLDHFFTLLAENLFRTPFFHIIGQNLFRTPLFHIIGQKPIPYPTFYDLELEAAQIFQLPAPFFPELNAMKRW